MLSSILARARGANLVARLAPPDADVDGATAILDAAGGTLVIEPTAATVASAEARRSPSKRQTRAPIGRAAEPAFTAEGVPVIVLVNIDHPRPSSSRFVRRRLPHAHGVPAPPRRDAGRRDAVRVLHPPHRPGRRPPVTIGTLDEGGDMPVAGLTVDAEANPFLGVRGVRRSPSRPEMLRVQSRALARAAACAPVPLEVLGPMVTVPAELAQAQAMMAQEIAALRAAGIGCAEPVMGTMIEVPAAALTATALDAGFFSIGSDDLAHYVPASARDNPSVASLADPTNPAVLELIVRTVAAGAERGVEVSIRGHEPMHAGVVGRGMLDAGCCAPRLDHVAPNRSRFDAT